MVLYQKKLRNRVETMDCLFKSQQKKDIDEAINQYQTYRKLIEEQRKVLESLEHVAFSTFVMRCERIKEREGSYPDFFSYKQPNCS